MRTLAETHALFVRMLDDPEAEAAAGLRLRGPGADDAARRFRLYRSLNDSRLSYELRRLFPLTASLLADSFAVVVREAARPPALPAGPALAGYDAVAGAFPDVLRRTTRVGLRPDAADLAQIERLRDEAAHAADAAPISAAVMASLEARVLAQAAVTFVPSMRLVTLAHDILPLWTAVDAGSPPPPPCASITTFAVWRRGTNVCLSRRDEREGEALHRAASGAPLEHVLEAFGSDGESARHAYTALRGWFDEGLVAAVGVVRRPLAPSGS